MNYNLRTWFFVSLAIYCLTFFAESIGGLEYARIVDGRTKHVATSSQRPTANWGNPVVIAHTDRVGGLNNNRSL
jgi:hypothetical protein